MEKLIFEKTVKGKRAVLFSLKKEDANVCISKELLRHVDSQLPEVSELDVVRHFTNLSKLNFSVDSNFYPLGSCTMKYNPKICEDVASLNGFNRIHPMLAQLGGLEECTQGSLEVIFNMQNLLSEIAGMDSFSLQPFAGAHGELTGCMIISAYHKKKQNTHKKYIIVPDSSHGTNPASAAIAGYEIISIASDETGEIDIKKFKDAMTDEVAGVMMTCPNTLGLFNPNIHKLAEIAHEKDALLYYDGANLNAILGKCRPGDLGFDIIHINLHKTFATPHGSGGPGSGPVGVSKKLSEFLPVPHVVRNAEGEYKLDFNKQDSIGHIASFYGNFLVVLKAYVYITMLGKEGLIRVSENAVLNANYIMERLKPWFSLPYQRRCMHECVFSAKKQLENNIRAIDIAKALIDEGIHPPTIYFPLIVKEAIMIEPTETESKQSIDNFIDTMINIAKIAKENPELLHRAPQKTSVGRLDELKAAKDMIFTCVD